MKLQDQANKLAEAIKESDEYKAFKNAIAEVEGDKEAEDMVKELKVMQFEIQRATARGEKIDEEKVRASQELYHSCIVNPKLANFFQAEFKFTKVMEDIQKIITSAVE
ncbi:MAG: YlbF family regulator [Tissierellales bacterium]|jgi:cell fate (sporulation/competence/biofilm development) regulator YlbF (YheA/YmcA/DUF963 family)|nr:YlbF family regulator [Tissierellales bacterium]